MVDTAIVDGHPVVAFLRTRYFTITTTEDQGPWWDSAIAELVIRDLGTGTDRVLRSQDVGWESAWREPSLGSQLALEAVDAYGGEGHWVELRSFDGVLIDPGFPLPRCDFCELAADLPPTGNTLVSARTDPGQTWQASTTIEVVSIDVTSGSEQQRVTITPGEAVWPVFVDTLEEHTLVLASRASTPADTPTLIPGDQGPWVQLLQDQLSGNDIYLVPDGIFGPRTEAAVRAHQAASDLPATGIVDAATWDRLSGPFRIYNDPILIDPAGNATNLTLTRPTTPVIYPFNRGPTITLWSGPTWSTTTPPAARDVNPPDALPILRSDGIGPHNFGTEMSAVMSWAIGLFGAPTLGGTPEASTDRPVVESVVPNLLYICGDQVAAHWETAALDLYFAQWELDDDGLVSCDEPMRLVAWGVGSYLGLDTSRAPRSTPLTTEAGIGVGTTVAELVQLETDPAFMQWSDSGIFPAGFYLGDPVSRDYVFGVLAWNWLRDLQEALNDHGYQLAVDGEAGPRTRAALEGYRIEQQLPSIEQAILDLTLEPNADIKIASMAAGHWPLEFECGTLELIGWQTSC